MKHSTKTGDDKIEYDKKILVLEEKNDALLKGINENNETDKSKWSMFKKEFKHDIDGLGVGSKDVWVKNTN